MKPKLILTIAGLAVVTQVSAQQIDASEEEIFELNPFLVDASQDRGYYSANAFSAYRVNIPVAEIPFNIQIVNEEFIEDLQATTLEQVSKYIPGISQPVENNSIHDSAGFVIRGMGISRAKRNGFNRYYMTDTTNIARIEVVKGPASALFGTSEPGGVINYVTKGATRIASGEVGVTVGTWDYYRFNASLSGPLIEDQLFFRFDGSYIDRKGYRDWEAEERSFFSGLLEWEPSDRINLRADIEYTDREFNPVSRNLVWNPEAYQRWLALPEEEKFANGTLRGVPRTVEGQRLWTHVAEHFPLTLNTAGPDAYNNTKILVSTLEAQVTITDNIDFRGMISYGDHDIDNYFASANRTRVTGDGVSRSHRSNINGNDTISWQTDFVGKYELGNTKHRVLIGAEFWEDEFSTFSRRDSPPSQLLYFNPGSVGILPEGADILDFRLDPQERILRDSSSSNINFGYYISYQLKAFDDRLNVLAGVRRDKSEAEDEAGNETRPDIQETSPQIGVNFRLTPHAVLFANYSESFVPQGGLFRDLPGGAGREEDIVETPRLPQIGEGFEFGIKLDQLLDGKISGTISFFSIDRGNVVVPLVVFPDGPDTPETSFRADRYIDGESSEGLEVALIYAPIPNWQILINYTTMDAERNDPTVEDSPFRNYLVAIPGVPDDQWSIWTKYSFEENLIGLSVGGGLVWMDERRGGSTLDDFITLESFTRFDLYVNYEWDMGDGLASVSLNIENLLDERYFRPGPIVENPMNGKLAFKYKF